MSLTVESLEPMNCEHHTNRGNCRINKANGKLRKCKDVIIDNHKQCGRYTCFQYQDRTMTIKDFEGQIASCKRMGQASTNLDKIVVNGIVARTIRLCVEHPELAKEYCDKMPKTVME